MCLGSISRVLFNLTQAVSMPMMRFPPEWIITVSSVVGVTGNAGKLIYAASKVGSVYFLSGRRVLRSCTSIKSPESCGTWLYPHQYDRPDTDEKVVAEWSKSIALRRAGGTQRGSSGSSLFGSDSLQLMSPHH